MAYDNRNGNRPQRRDAPREFFKATCADCGKECEIPFRPTEASVPDADFLEKGRPPEGPWFDDQAIFLPASMLADWL